MHLNRTNLKQLILWPYVSGNLQKIMTLYNNNILKGNAHLQKTSHTAQNLGLSHLPQVLE